MSKFIPPKPEHLRWLIASRQQIQTTSLDLYQLIRTNKVVLSNKGNSEVIHDLSAICFSLWRAAFLAEKRGVRKDVIDHAVDFLGRVLTNNAIGYSDERQTQEWAYNYYMGAAKNSLRTLYKRWPKVQVEMSKKITEKHGTPKSQRRWNRYQNAFTIALDCLRLELTEGLKP